MANLRNEFEFRSALLTALGQEHTEAEAKNEDTWRRKMLDNLGVEYDQNDVNQFGLFREKLIEGVTKKSEGGGSSDFSTATVTLINETMLGLILAHIDNTTGIKTQMGQSGEYEVVLYKGKAVGLFTSPSGNLSVTGNITYNDKGELVITGDCTITIGDSINAPK